MGGLLCIRAELVSCSRCVAISLLAVRHGYSSGDCEWKRWGVVVEKLAVFVGLRVNLEMR